jgi:hypothetical protein
MQHRWETSDMHTEFSQQDSKEENNYSDLDLDERMILKWIFKSRMEQFGLD